MYPQKWIKHDLIIPFFTMHILARKRALGLNPAGDEAP